MKKIIIALTIIFSSLFAAQLAPAVAFAELGSAGGGGDNQSTCGDTKTQLVACDKGTKTGLSAINGLITMTIQILSVLVGTVAVGGLGYAAVLYASAQDNGNQVSEAKTIARNIVIGLLLYVFTIAILNWLIPGGIIGSSGGGDTSADGTSNTSQQSNTQSNSQSSGGSQ